MRVAALARRTWATVKPAPPLLAHLEWWRAYYHGCRVLTNHCEWRSCSHESQRASWRRNAIGTLPLQWQPAEPPDDGPPARCSLAPCRRFPGDQPLKHLCEECHVEDRWLKVLAEALAWSLTPGREGLSGLPHAKKPARSGLVEGWSIYPPYPVAVPKARRCQVHLRQERMFQENAISDGTGHTHDETSP
jgi:hypothetical protein